MPVCGNLHLNSPEGMEKVDIENFLELSKQYPVFDVRSPSEFNHAHIPGAYNLPLFSDEERRIVGTTYKQQSREQAIKTGLDFFGPKMKKMVEEVESLTKNPTHQLSVSDLQQLKSTRCILVHCWRGGMRSAGVAWLMDLYGFKVYTLIGGYKRFRHHVLNAFEQPYRFNIIGGYTGSGKTYLLREMQNRGEATLDLESLAQHKGSAFGAIGQPSQPSQEMFENLLATNLRESVPFPESPIWIEDESQRIGLVNIPQPLWNRMRQSNLFFLDIPFEVRLDHIVKEYGYLDQEKMVKAIIRISKRLGGLETKTAIHHLLENNTRESFRILLSYYDKYYSKGLNSRKEVDCLLTKLPFEEINAVANANKLLARMKRKVRNSEFGVQS